MPLYSSTTTAESGVVVNAVLDSDTNIITWTATAPNGAVATTTQSADIRFNTAVPGGGTLIRLSEGLRSQGVQRTGLTFALSDAQNSVEDQKQRATAAAAATNTTVPAAPNPPAPTSNAADPAVPPAAPQPSAQTPAATAPAGVSTLDDPEARAIQDAIDADIAAQEGSAFPPVDSPAPVGDEALQAIEDNQAAALAAQEGSAFAAPPPVNTLDDPEARAIQDALDADLAAQEGRGFPPVEAPAPVSASGDEALQAIEDNQAAALAAQEGSAFGALPNAQGITKALTADAQRQNTLNDRVALPQAADWRVRLSLANGADYLYRAQPLGILAPLARTNGVVFPYTPSIETSYQAKYDAVDLTHSNYKGYFYKSSSVDQISIRGTFTAQDTREAEYLLAVITFFKAVTKMFYGASDPLAGSPPPLVFLSGLGQYQFNNNPCVVSNFQYSLPSDVDYIRANGFNNYGINLDNRRQQSSQPPATGILGAIATVNRLRNNFLAPGAINSNDVGQSPVSANNSKTNYTNSTYVPTKMDINVTLLPIQTRSQISQQFNLQKFANGSLLQQGFW